jgi:hypothetical protein
VASRTSDGIDLVSRLAAAGMPIISLIFVCSTSVVPRWRSTKEPRSSRAPDEKVSVTVFALS